ncbi:MAG: hypothetical protein ABSF14_23325, partial [Terriglobia bacterium]
PTPMGQGGLVANPKSDFRTEKTPHRCPTADFPPVSDYSLGFKLPYASQCGRVVCRLLRVFGPAWQGIVGDDLTLDPAHKQCQNS